MMLSKLIFVVLLLFSGCAITEVIEKQQRLEAQIYVTSKEYMWVTPMNEYRMDELDLLKEPFVDGFGENHVASIVLERSYLKIMDLIQVKSFFNQHPINGFKGEDLRKVIYADIKAIVAFSALDRGQHFSGKYLLSLEGKEIKIKYLGHYDANPLPFSDDEH